MAKKRATKKAAAFDYSNEEEVKQAMAKALECSVDELEIKESHLSSFGHFVIYQIDWGSQEYSVAEDNDCAEKLAVAIVKQDLEESPENFEPNFIESHIDLKRLRSELQSDVESMRLDDLTEEAQKRPLRFMKDNDIDIDEPPSAKVKEYIANTFDVEIEESSSFAAGKFSEIRAMDAEDQWSEIGEDPEVKDRDIESIAEAEAKARLKDPVEYLKDIYGDDAVKKAIEIAGIDVDATAEEAVSTDGAGHFLSGYDSTTYDGPHGIVYWRNN